MPAKTAKKKPAAKKSAAKKPAAKKPMAKKTTAKKAPAKKPAAKKPMAKKTAAKKAPAKKKSTRKPSAAFMKPLTPSADLAKVVGAKPLPRTAVTSALWKYIKKYDLQDPKNKRMIKADAALKPVFGGKATVSMFEMTALVSKHLK